VAAYAEVRALIGGTTAIAGIAGRRGASAPVPNCLVGPIRSLDWASGFYGATVGHERIENALGVTPRDLKESDAQRLADALATKKLDLLLVHVAEGSPLDVESSVEFRALKGVGLLGAHTAIIHGTALGVDEFRQMREAGTALVWSPRSNVELYNVTTNIMAALRQGVTIALAPDWAPTGSSNLLAEVQYASRWSREQLFGLLSDRQLFEMATAIPARLAGAEDRIGSLRPGLYADLFVVKGDAAQPFAALAHARPEDVQLVVVGGVPLYGGPSLMGQFPAAGESLETCGRPMLLNAAALPGGRFAEVSTRLTTALKSYGLELAPLAECP